MKIHLKFIYGCDDRYEITKNVIPLCKDYFDYIVIYNCGNRNSTCKFENLPDNCKIEYFDSFMGDMESVLRGMLKTVVVGDWLMWLDADEIPSQIMLDNIKKDVDFLEKNGYNSCRFPSIGHENGIIWQDLNLLPKTYDEYVGSTTYAARKLVKKDELYITSNFGAHYDYFSKNGDKCYYFPHYVNHIKSKNQTPQSCALRGYTIPFVDESPNEISKILNSKEYADLRKFQNDTNVKTSPELFFKVNVEKSEEFILKYKNLLESFKNSDIYTFKQMSNLLDFGVNFNTVMYNCENECCNYKNKKL